MAACPCLGLLRAAFPGGAGSGVHPGSGTGRPQGAQHLADSAPWREKPKRNNAFHASGIWVSDTERLDQFDRAAVSRG